MTEASKSTCGVCGVITTFPGEVIKGLCGVCEHSGLVWAARQARALNKEATLIPTPAQIQAGGKLRSRVDGVGSVYETWQYQDRTYQVKYSGLAQGPVVTLIQEEKATASRVLTAGRLLSRVCGQSWIVESWNYRGRDYTVKYENGGEPEITASVSETKTPVPPNTTHTRLLARFYEKVTDFVSTGDRDQVLKSLFGGYRSKEVKHEDDGTITLWGEEEEETRLPTKEEVINRGQYTGYLYLYEGKEYSLIVKDGEYKVVKEVK